MAAACGANQEDPEQANRYTIRGNRVAVVTDGSAVLGLGDVGPAAAKPVTIEPSAPDTAVVEEILRKTYPFSDLQQPANVLVFPRLSAANMYYRLLSRPGGSEAIGPVLLGTEKPVHILQRGATVAEIVKLVSIAVVDARTRRRQTALDL